MGSELSSLGPFSSGSGGRGLRGKSALGSREVACSSELVYGCQRPLIILVWARALPALHSGGWSHPVLHLNDDYPGGGRCLPAHVDVRAFFVVTAYVF